MKVVKAGDPAFADVEPMRFAEGFPAGGFSLSNWKNEVPIFGSGKTKEKAGFRGEKSRVLFL